MKWESLYVALSHVRRKDNVRLLLRMGDQSTIGYISELEKDKYTKWYFSGYPETTEHQGAHWDRALACRAAGFNNN